VLVCFQFLSAKFLAKRPDPKLTQVTIIHSSTTETVRLPAGGVDPAAPGPPTIVHPAGRGKLPLKRRVRLDRRRRKDGRKTAPAPSAPPQTAVAAAAAAAPAAATAVPAALAAATAPQSSAPAADLASMVAALDAMAASNKKALKKVSLVAFFIP